jgi:hypothetical protein
VRRTALHLKHSHVYLSHLVRSTVRSTLPGESKGLFATMSAGEEAVRRMLVDQKVPLMSSQDGGGPSNAYGEDDEHEDEVSACATAVYCCNEAPFQLTHLQPIFSVYKGV